MKYVWCILIFFLVYCFIDDNGLPVAVRLHKKISNLETQKKEMRESILQDSLQIIKMNNDIDEIERFGREQYYMKRYEEVIYIIKRDK